MPRGGGDFFLSFVWMTAVVAVVMGLVDKYVAEFMMSLRARCIFNSAEGLESSLCLRIFKVELYGEMCDF